MSRLSAGRGGALERRPPQESVTLVPKSLVIVESPAKARTINRYLGRDFSVEASMGHVRDLPKKKLGVDLKNRFQPTYELIPGKEKVIKTLRSAARGVDSIYIATDPDREGEAIGWHLSEALSDNNRKFFRVLFNEITQKAVRQAFDRPGEIDSRLVDAQQARRILDRLVGYKISPLLWQKVRRGTSAGRVQTAALRLVVEREREIEAFESREYWTLTANLSASQPPPFEARLQKFKRKKIEVGNGEQAQEIVQALDGASFTVETVTTKEKKRNPVPPFITSKLQQEASRKLRFPVKKTMRVAQSLYEGIKLGQEGSIGLITYMRTDSLRVSSDALGEVRTYIAQNYGEQYLPAKARYYRSRKDAQDAHEAIRPTSATRRPGEIRQFLSDDEFKLYKLIWQRFVASQMQAALLDQTVVDIAAGPYLFRASGSVLKFDGFLKVYEEGRDDKTEEEPAASLPPLTRGEVLQLNKLLPEQHFTQPPPRFTEATLVKALEEKGIGRPSTYAAILTTIQDREYTVRKEGRFRPTDLGLVVNDLLVASFADLFDIQYTARMEKELDEIEQGKIPWIKALQDFYGKFATDLDQARSRMKVKEEPTGESCDKCGKSLVIRWGRHGRFVACSGFPACKNTRELSAKAEGADRPAESDEETPQESCPTCGKPMALKKGRFGPFLACTGYPQCKTTRKPGTTGSDQAPPAQTLLEEKCPRCDSPLAVRQGRYGEFTACSDYPKCRYVRNKTLEVACPQPDCSGEIVERKSRRGKTFYGCDRYPKCRFVLWNKPIKKACPQCDAGFVLEKATKKQGILHYCHDESCDFRESAGTVA